MKPRHLPVLLALLLPVAVSSRAQTAEEWIVKARAFLGGDKALDAVRSIHFTGTLEATERVPSETDKNVMISRPATRRVDIIFEKPFRQRIMVTGPKVIETTALDGYDAWLKRINAENPAQWQVTLLDATQVKRLRANTLENLNFYSTRAMPGCVVQSAGEAVVEGVSCVKLTFTHTGNIVFVRYFNKATGQLVKTETENGGEIREEGEIVVGGIRFPKRVVNRTANGGVTAINFDQVTLNETFPAEAFTVPSLQTR